jgi:hypothetical protein
VRLRLQRRDLETLIKIPIRHEHAQRGVQHHKGHPHRVHDAFGIEQAHADHLVQHRGGEVIGSQRRKLVAEAEQFGKEWRFHLLAMVHGGSLPRRQRCHGDAYAGDRLSIVHNSTVPQQ